MKIKLPIQRKLTLYTLVIVLLTYVLAVGFVVVILGAKARTDAETYATTYAREIAASIKSRMNLDLGTARAMAATIQEYHDSIAQGKFLFVDRSLQAVLKREKNYNSTWTSLEIARLNPAWTKDHGRIRFNCVSADVVERDSANINGDVPGSLYFRLKHDKKEDVSEPYRLNQYDEGNTAQADIVGTSISVPMLTASGEFEGVAGIDLSIEQFRYVAGLKPFSQSSCFLMAGNGTFVFHPDSALVGTTLADYLGQELMQAQAIEAHIGRQEAMAFYLNRPAIFDNEDIYMVAIPIAMGNSDKPWALGIVVPESVLVEEVNTMLWIILAVSCVGVLILVISIRQVALGVARPLREVNQLLKDVAEGNIDVRRKVVLDTGDEVNEIADSTNVLIDTLNEKVAFAQAIGQGELDVPFRVLGDQDHLGLSLQRMRTSLKAIREDEQKRTWSANGLARFSEMLRQNHTDLTLFYNQFIAEWTKYIKAEQCGLFILQRDADAEPHLELVAAYAFERRKYLEKRVDLGQGLLGQCFYERQTIYIKDVPEQYVSITSGLGGARPGNLVMIPLLAEDQVYGVVEFAAFGIFPEHVIALMEKIAQSLATTVATLQRNTETRLLLEQTRQQTEEMRASEEEMRQNMEELEATQEEMRRGQQKHQEQEARQLAVEKLAKDAVLIADRQLRITYINAQVKEIWGGKAPQPGDSLLHVHGAQRDLWEPHYQRALLGERREFMLRRRRGTTDQLLHYIISAYYPDGVSGIQGVVMLVRDVTTVSQLAHHEEEPVGKG